MELLPLDDHPRKSAPLPRQRREPRRPARREAVSGRVRAGRYESRKATRSNATWVGLAAGMSLVILLGLLFTFSGGSTDSQAPEYATSEGSRPSRVATPSKRKVTTARRGLKPRRPRSIPPKRTVNTPPLPRDTTPPKIDLDRPGENATLYELRVTVSGTVNEAVRYVRINGVLAGVSFRQFVRDVFFTTAGEKQIEVVAVDNSGNRAVLTRKVRIVLPDPIPKATYLSRFPAKRADLLRRGGGTSSTEKAVLAGLIWLRNHQSSGGRWDGDAFKRQCKKNTCGGPAKRADLLRRGGGTSSTEKAVMAGLIWLRNHQSSGGRWDGDAFKRQCKKNTCGGPAKRADLLRRGGGQRPTA